MLLQGSQRAMLGLCRSCGSRGQGCSPALERWPGEGGQRRPGGKLLRPRGRVRALGDREGQPREWPAGPWCMALRSQSGLSLCSRPSGMVLSTAQARHLLSHLCHAAPRSSSYEEGDSADSHGVRSPPSDRDGDSTTPGQQRARWEGYWAT